LIFLENGGVLSSDAVVPPPATAPEVAVSLKKMKWALFLFYVGREMSNFF
jgi:hypothetical protein